MNQFNWWPLHTYCVQAPPSPLAMWGIRMSPLVQGACYSVPHVSGLVPGKWMLCSYTEDTHPCTGWCWLKMPSFWRYLHLSEGEVLSATDEGMGLGPGVSGYSCSHTPQTVSLRRRETELISRYPQCQAQSRGLADICWMIEWVHGLENPEVIYIQLSIT